MTWDEYKSSLPQTELDTIFVENRKGSRGYNKHYRWFKRISDERFLEKERGYSRKLYKKRSDLQKQNDRLRGRRSSSAYKKRNPGKLSEFERFALNFRQRIRSYLKGSGLKTVEILGCSKNEFREHLQSLFTEGMSWDNYGYGFNKWTLDHIVPLATCKGADGYIDRELCIRLNHYTNLRPLWLSENCSKGARLIER